MSRASSLQTQIRSQHEWAWANDEKNQSELNNALSELKAGLTPFAMDFLTMDMKDVRSKFDAEELDSSCLAMANVLDPKLKKVDVKAKALLSMHAAKLKADTSA